MAISKVIPQKSHPKCAFVGSKRRSLPSIHAPDSSSSSSSILSLLSQPLKQSGKSWRKHCQQPLRLDKQNKDELEKHREQNRHQKNQLNSSDSSSRSSNITTSLRLGLIGGGNLLINKSNEQQFDFGTNKPKKEEEEELLILNGCYTVIKSMKLADNSNYSTRRSNKLSNFKYLSKLAFIAFSLVALSSLFLTASRANVLSLNNERHSPQEFDLNKHREILDRIAQESFRNSINQQQQQEFSKHNQFNQLDKPPVDNQLVPATQQHNSNLPAMVQQQQQQNHQVEVGGGNSQFVRLLSNQPAQAASNSEPVWTSSEPMLGEQTPFIPDSSNSGAENNKNFNPDQPAISNDAFPGLALDQQQQQQQQQQSPQPQQQHHHQQGQYISYRPLIALKPTTPSLNRQLLAPPPFYELGLTPINAVQVEHDVHGAQEITNSDTSGKEAMISAASSPIARQNGARSLHHHLSQHQHQHQQLLHQKPVVDQNMLLLNPTSRSNLFQQQNNFEQQQNSFGVSSSSTNSGETAQQNTQNSDNNQPKNANEESSNTNSIINSNNNNNNNGVSGGETSKSNSESGNNSNSSNELQPVDKAIEPRQKRRIFNRILKKAEWNHLFVELSKVFLRYFLDLALKDIIGKQSGGDTTTSRKKLDAQSELTDLLKDFVKTAISNI